jgi:hypothetical protein
VAKTEKELREEFERYSARENWSAWLIVAALVMEAYAAWYFSTPDRPWYETTFLIAANLTIAGGVYGEIRFGRKADAVASALQQISDQNVAEANARADEANQKAQEAALELVRYRQPRSFTREQMYRIAEKLKPHAGMQFAGATVGRNPEYLGFLQFIEMALTLSDWREIDWHVSSGITRSAGRTTIGTDVSVSNVLITFPLNNAPKSVEAAAVALADALTAEGFAAQAGLDMRNTGVVHVIVGPKT